MPMLDVDRLSVRYGTKQIVDALSFSVSEGQWLMIAGPNGAGKSTALAAITQGTPYTGRVLFEGQNVRSMKPALRARAIGVLAQNHFVGYGFTVEEVVRLGRFAYAGGVFGRSREDDAGHVEQALTLTGLQDKRRQSVLTLSGGELQRTFLAQVLAQDPKLLLLDEPTNHLDMHAVEWLEGYIEKFRGTVLTISHDRYFLDRVVTRIIELHDGKAEFYSGNYSFYVQEKQARFDLQLKQYEKEQAKLGQLGFTLERMKGWGINNRTLYRRAMSIQHRMERIEKTDRPTQEKTLRARFAQRDFFGDEVLSVKGLGKAYDGRTLFSDVELQVAGGERIALLGDNGTGKSTFLKLLLGEEAGAGRVKFGPTVKWAYLPQIIHFAHPERTLLDTMLYEKNCTVQTARDRLGAYLFEGEDVFKTVSSLSGGEQSRLRLCMLMDEKINLLVLDEPTNHLDIDSREWLEDALEDYEGTLIFVSHDRYFVNKFATRIWELENGHIRNFPCGYEKYRSIKEKEAIAAPAPEKPKKERKEKPKTSGSKMLEKQIRALEREIEKQEQHSAELDRQIEAASSDYQELARLMAEKQSCDDALTGLMDEWERLSSDLEGAT